MAGGGIGASQGGFPQQSGQPQQPGFGQQPGQMPQKPGQPFQMPLPEGYQSPYANYGFDPGLQSYLDQQNYRSTFDAGVGYQYDPTNQTFTGGTMGGTYNPIPLNVMQQAAGGNRDVLNPYFQSRFPQPTTPPPTVKPGMPQFPRFGQQIQGMLRGQPSYSPTSQEAYNRFTATAKPVAGGSLPSYEQFVQNINTPNPLGPQRPGTNVMPQPQPPQQRGLGGLQMNKFRNRLG
jgi:hypothetical protein